MGKKLVDLQKQAASTVDSLLHITEDIGKYVIAPYGTEDGAFVEIQCQIFLKRCQSLEKQLLQLQEALTFSENPAPPIFHNEASSLDVTRQIPFPLERARRRHPGISIIARTNQAFGVSAYPWSHKKTLETTFVHSL